MHHKNAAVNFSQHLGKKIRTTLHSSAVELMIPGAGHGFPWAKNMLSWITKIL